MSDIMRHWLTALKLSLAVLLATQVPCHAKAQKAVASIDTTSIRIGEQILLKLDVTLPKGAKVIWPLFNDSTLSPVEIVKAGRVDTIETNRNSYLQYKQLLTITAFDSGYKTIPPITFEYIIPGDTSRLKAVTDSLLLQVRTVEVDTTRSIKDIKAPMSAPLTLEELWPIFAGVAGLGLIAGFIWYYLWRRKMRKPLFPVIRKQQLPSWQTALESLNELEKKKLWQSGKIKEYYTELTDILRQYLESEFKIPAMEMISSDILEAINDHDRLKPVKEKMGQVLQLADLVKFAKEMPLPSEHDSSMKNTRTIVMETKPAESAEKAELIPDTPTEQNG